MIKITVEADQFSFGLALEVARTVLREGWLAEESRSENDPIQHGKFYVIR